MPDHKKSRLEQQIQFLLEIDRLKQIGRQNYLADGSRKENDVEHSWHLAMMALLLSEYANEEVDVLKVMSMVLIHDIVEIDAGDTYAYDMEGRQTQREREEKAAERIFHLLPDDQAAYMRDLWEEFEAKETPEAKFSRALDNLQPMMLNVASGGKSWTEHEVKLSQILERNEITPKGSKMLWEYAKEQYIAPNIENNKIKKDISF